MGSLAVIVYSSLSSRGPMPLCQSKSATNNVARVRPNNRRHPLRSWFVQTSGDPAKLAENTIRSLDRTGMVSNVVTMQEQLSDMRCPQQSSTPMAENRFRISPYPPLLLSAQSHFKGERQVWSEIHVLFSLSAVKFNFEQRCLSCSSCDNSAFNYFLRRV